MCFFIADICACYMDALREKVSVLSYFFHLCKLIGGLCYSGGRNPVIANRCRSTGAAIRSPFVEPGDADCRDSDVGHCRAMTEAPMSCPKDRKQPSFTYYKLIHEREKTSCIPARDMLC